MPDAPVITRRTKTGVDARCSLCPGLMVLWADRDAHSSWHTPAEPPAPPAPAPPPTPTAPAGYRHLVSADFRTGGSWVPDSGRPNNAEGTDRAANALFGQGPDGTSAVLLFNRGADGQPFTADIMGRGMPHPILHAGRCTFSHDGVRPGIWPAFPWFRPLDGGRGEVDINEMFGGHGPFAPAGSAAASWPTTALTVHDTGVAPAPYQLGRAPQVRLPDTLEAGVVYEQSWVITEAGVTTTVPGGSATVTRERYDARYGAGTYMTVIGDPKRMWYPRATLQAGGPDAGPVPAGLKEWRLWLHSLDIFVPVA